MSFLALGQNKEVESKSLESHLSRLRKKINDKFKDNNFILSNDDGYFIK